MTITREADYALRITALLSKAGKLVDAKEIAEQSLVPYRFTLKILRKLVQAGVAKSYRGVNGGYIIDRLPEEVTLKEIIEIIDGPIAVNRCIAEPEICKNAGFCQIQKQLLKAQDAFSDELSSKSFKEILED